MKKQPETLQEQLEELQKLADYVKIPFDEVLNSDKSMKQIKKELQKRILDTHKYEIYFSNSEHCWRTYLPDEKASHKRRPIKRKELEDLHQAIVIYYMEKNLLEDVANSTLQQVYEKWLIYSRDHTAMKSKTLYEYANDWKKFLVGTTLASMQVKDIEPTQIKRFFQDMTKNRDVTLKRASNVRSLLNHLFLFAIDEKIIQINPVASAVNLRKLTLKPVMNQDDNVYSEEEMLTLLHYLKDINEPYAVAIQLMFYLFIRIGELKAIKYEDIDFKNRTVSLQRQALTDRELQDDLSFSSRNVVVSNQMKGNTSFGFRKQYLTDEALYLIHKAILLNPDGEFLFEPDGRLMTTDRFNRRLQKYCEDCNVFYRSSHKIRFFNCSTAYDGTNLKELQRCMGHSRLSTTEHYLRNVRKQEDTRIPFNRLGLSSVQDQGNQQKTLIS